MTEKFVLMKYNQLRSTNNLTGQGDGDDESLVLQLNKIPAEIERVAIAVTIHDFEARKQNFGQVSNAFIRVVNKDSGVEIVRYDLSEDASTETAMIWRDLSIRW